MELRIGINNRWKSITEDRIRSNLSKTKNIPPKTLIFSDFVVPLPYH